MFLAAFGLHRALQVRKSFGKALLTKQQISHTGVGLPIEAAGERVAQHLLHDVLSVVVPFELGVAARQPRPRLGDDERFGSVKARDVGESGSRLNEVAFLKLRFAHQQPGVLQKGIELLPAQVAPHLGRAAFVGADGGATFDGVELDGLFALGDGGFRAVLVVLDIQLHVIAAQVVVPLFAVEFQSIFGVLAHDGSISAQRAQKTDL